ncbi:MAG: hypothetical protein MUO26_04985 [Methanotrichaceae archaeon]|nr:hypothetical protein [Methanotrichaceae archaeon]
MAKFHIKWLKNESLMPQDPAMMAKLQLSMLEGVKASLKSGKLTDWGSYCDASGGYCVMEGNEAEIFDEILKWYPYVSFDAKPVLSVDQVIGGINKAMTESKPK